MKNLKLSDLENISGGNHWLTIGTYIFCTIIIAEILYLQYKITYGYNDTDDILICPSVSYYNKLIRRLYNCN